MNGDTGIDLCRGPACLRIYVLIGLDSNPFHLLHCLLLAIALKLPLDQDTYIIPCVLLCTVKYISQRSEEFPNVFSIQIVVGE